MVTRHFSLNCLFQVESGVSEIILVVVDYQLAEKGYTFIRHIDDYVCLTKNYETAENFLTDLSNELRKFGLILNGKKVSIEDLPATRNSSWIVDISNHPVSLIDYSQSYLKVL